jgi:hypothetical protein
MKILIALVLCCFLVLLLIGCNTVHKSVQSVKLSTDSTVVSKNEASAVLTKDSSGTKTEHNEYQRETVYEYDTVYRVIKGDLRKVYVPRIVKVYENGTFTKREASYRKSTDSVVAKQTDSAKVIRTSEAHSLQKKSSRVPIGLIIVSGIVFLLLLIFFIVTRRTL